MGYIVGTITLFGTLFAGLVFLSFLLSYPLMLLWNGCLVDAVTVVKPVTWLQMWGLTFLFSALFKSSVSTTKDK